ncbi:unnamed protein product, partial [Mesorhabditis spiculigera]
MPSRPTSSSQQFADFVASLPQASALTGAPAALAPPVPVEDAEKIQAAQAGPSTSMLSEPALYEVRRNLDRRLNAAQESALEQTASPQPGADLREFLNSIDEFVPAIPDSVTQYYMHRAGVDSADPRIVRLISLATQKFISDIALDCQQQARMKGLGVRPSKRSTDKNVKYTLTPELLETVLQEYGMTMPRAPYYH